MSGISDKAIKSNYAENKYRFIGQLYDDELDWDTYQMKYRTMDPQLGRFWQVDPLASKYPYNSTFAYAENRVIDGIDLEGKEFTYGPAPAENYAAVGHLFNPKTITTETVQAAAQMQQQSDQLNVKVLPLVVVGSLEPQYAIPAAISYITGLPVSPAPQAMAGGALAEGAALAGTAGGAEGAGTAQVSTSFSLESAPKSGLSLNAGAGDGTTTLYRAVSPAELGDISANGFRNISTGYETGKLFATSAEDAARFGKNNFTFDGIPNTIVQAEVPSSVMNTATHFEADAMNAVSIPAQQLPAVKSLGPLNFSPQPTKPFALPGW